jgi:hypothetical protein
MPIILLAFITMIVSLHLQMEHRHFFLIIVPKENILNNTVYQNKFANALDVGIVNAINNKNS